MFNFSIAFGVAAAYVTILVNPEIDLIRKTYRLIKANHDNSGNL